MEISREVISWLIEGDPSIAFQTKRDLLDVQDLTLQQEILKKGWGSKFLEQRKNDGHWGLRFYQPKWTSTHYTLLDIRNLCPIQTDSRIKASIELIAIEEKGTDGGINPSGSIRNSDVCINGMFLNYACYFLIEEQLLRPIIDFILSQRMSDGGFNCMLNRSGAIHSSMHTSISTIEGLAEYRLQGYTYRLEETIAAENTTREFLLKHNLFRSDKSGEVIHGNFLKMPYPTRWRYDFLRALDHFRHANAAFDERLMPAIDWLLCKKKKDGLWKLSAKYPGKTHFEMEKAGKASRWNTLRALRILKYYGVEG